jgi:hypothetical protein
MQITARDACGLLVRALDRFNETCEAASMEEWSHRPSDTSWCIGDVAEHVSIANAGFGDLLSMLATGPDVARGCALLDEEIPFLFERVGDPGDLARPTGTFASDRSTFREFADGAARLRLLASRANDDLRSRALPHPFFGPLDGIQWLLFAAAHTERHRSQVIGLRQHFATRHGVESRLR